jgi:PTH1 family peptidyl-tRNA hydrolase
LFLIVGLGNPGPNYQHNRHNVGQMVLDELARRMGASFKSHKTSSHIAEGRLNQSKVVLAKSNGYMNTSGAPVAALCKFFSVQPDQLIVVHDELDIPFGELRTKFSGGHAGHNGLRDIIAHLGNDYHRVRFGIGRPPGQMEVSDFVLQNFSPVERKELDVLIALAADKVEELVAPKLLQ